MVCVEGLYAVGAKGFKALPRHWRYVMSCPPYNLRKNTHTQKITFNKCTARVLCGVGGHGVSFSDDGTTTTDSVKLLQTISLRVERVCEIFSESVARTSRQHIYLYRYMCVCVG